MVEGHDDTTRRPGAATAGEVAGVDHLTLSCSPSQLATVRAFYEDVVGLAIGPRPDFDFPGTWLYAGGAPVVHLAAVRAEPTALAPTDALSTLGSRPSSVTSTGAIDHVALRIEGPVESFRAHLRACRIGFTEAPVPGFPLYQLFLSDPLGVKLELTFELPR